MDVWNKIKDTFEIAKKITLAVSKLSDPKEINIFREKTTKNYEILAAEGAFQIATKDAAHPKIAQLAADLEQMLEHPLSKMGLAGRKPPKIYIVEGLIPAAMVVTPEVIQMTRSAIETCESKELKFSLGHELAHILRGNSDATKGLEHQLKRNQRMERGADRLGFILTGDISAAKSSFEHIQEGAARGMHNMFQTAAEANPISSKLGAYGVNRMEQYGNRTYPPLRSRMHSLKKLAEQMSTPEGRQFVEAEEMRRLEEIHGQRK